MSASRTVSLSQSAAESRLDEIWLKFQSPDVDRDNAKRLSVTIDPQGKKLALRLGVKSGFLNRPDNLGDFSFAKSVSGDGPQEILIRREDFKSSDHKTLEWSKIATFEVTIIDLENKQKLDLTSPMGHAVLQVIKQVD